MKTVRRIIAENEDWRLAIVPDLETLCKNALYKKTLEDPIFIRTIPEKYLDEVLEHFKENYDFSLGYIKVLRGVSSKNEKFWHQIYCKVFRDSLFSGQTAKYNQIGEKQPDLQLWKDRFLSCAIQKEIEEFVPGISLDNTLRQLIEIAKTRKGIKALKVTQLLPPIKYPKECSDIVFNGKEKAPKIGRFNLKPIYQELNWLTKIILQAGITTGKIGMNYEPSFSKLTISEWQDIFEGLGYLKGLQDLEIYASQMSDENIELLSEIIGKNKIKLVNLNISKNKITLSSEIFDFTSVVKNLKSIDISENRITNEGAIRLANLLQDKNSRLENLRLDQNSIGNEGAAEILKLSSKLKEISLKMNHFDSSISDEICKSLDHKISKLQILNLSGNKLGAECGSKIAKELEENKTILILDVRLCDFGSNNEILIREIECRNQEIMITKKVKENFI